MVDERTDVYSVAATLYYLLTGRPPVQAKDAAEALARIASEPAPPLRGYRPDLPRALEAAIHRGLERDPARRWRNLQEFHDALVPFLAERWSIAGIGRRAGAYRPRPGHGVPSELGDFRPRSCFIIRPGPCRRLQFLEQFGLFVIWFERFLWVAYFAVLEGIGGASLGKWLAGLRVSRVDRGGPPGLGRGLVRTLVFFALTRASGRPGRDARGTDQGTALAHQFLGLRRADTGPGSALAAARPCVRHLVFVVPTNGSAALA